MRLKSGEDSILWRQNNALDSLSKRFTADPRSLDTEATHVRHARVSHRNLQDRVADRSKSAIVAAILQRLREVTHGLP